MHQSQVDSRQLAPDRARKLQASVNPLLPRACTVLQVGGQQPWLGGDNFQHVGRPTLGNHVGPVLPRNTVDRRAPDIRALGYGQTLHRANEYALLGFGEVAATDVRMHPGQGNFWMIGCDPAQGEIGAMLIAGHQMYNIEKQGAGQMQAQTRSDRTLDIAQVADTGNGGDGVKQADKTHMDVAVILPQELATEALCIVDQNPLQQSLTAQRHLVGEVTGGGCTATEAESVEGQ
ncbi:hypothetical protein D3C78_807370 [compost metagenome]